jgi:single-stranded-DNA-specific exonuclease
LGKDLFRELKLLEPCGIGNPAPKLFIPNCWFERVRNRNIQDHRGRKVRYIKTDFELWDDSAPAGFPGTWWEHYQDELPGNRCDAIVELDFNAYKKSYEVRLLSVRAAEQTNPIPVTAPIDWIVDWRAADRSAIDRPEDHPRQALPLRHEQTPIEEPIAPPPCPPALNRDRQIVPITRCPNSWDDMHQWLQRLPGQTIALAYAPPTLNPPIDIWQQLVGMAKYLSRTGTLSTRSHLQAKLGLSDRVLTVGLETLHYLGFDVHSSTTEVRISWTTDTETPIPTNAAIAEFLAMIEEEQFRRRYFFEVPLTTIQAVVSHSSGQQFPEPPMSEHRQPR